MSKTLKLIQFAKEEQPTLDSVFIKSKNYFLPNANDDWFENIHNIYTKATIFSAMVNNLHRCLIGKGLTSKNTRDQQIIKDLKLNKLFSNIFFDYSLYGCGSIDVHFNPEHSAVVALDYINGSNLRIGLLDTYNYEIKNLWYCSNWKKFNTLKIEQFQPFTTAYSEEDRQILYFHTTPLSLSVYPVPIYGSSGLEWANIERMCTRYNSNNIANNFSPNTLINFNDGEPTDEQKEEIIKQLESFKGYDSDFKTFVTFNTSKDNAATIERFNDAANDTQYLNLQKEYKQNIITSFGSNPALAGLFIEGSLGDKNSILEGYEKYLNTVIYPIREAFLEEFSYVNDLLLEPLTDYYFEDLTLFKDSTPAANDIKMSDAVITKKISR